MGKFKKGDRVRVIDGEDHDCFRNGDILVVDEDTEDCAPFCVRESGGKRWATLEHRLELVEEKPTVRFESNVTAQNYFFDEYMRYMWATEYYETSNNNLGETIMRTLKSIPTRLKKVLDKDYKAMYQLNWLNGDLERTSKGTEELMDFLIDKYKDDLGALAREQVKEIEEEDES